MSSTTRRDRIVGRYVLDDLLGEGATGEVWRANDPTIGRSVAVKLLKVPGNLGAAQREEWEQRFLREARAAGRLSHPGIVSIHDAGTSSEGRPYIVMELVEGRSLESYRNAKERAPLEQVVDWAIQVAEALDAAHRRGVVHRDIKPANILVDADGRARVADFGVARLAESELTREGSFLGSPAFAAPEQIRGAAVDGRSDLFSLGAVLYTLATGRRPFDGQDIAALAYAVCHGQPEAPRNLEPRIGAALEAAILRALAGEPSQRFQTGAEMAQALREVSEPAVERTLVGSAPMLDASKSGPSRKAALAIAGILVAAAALTLLGRSLFAQEEDVSRRAGLVERLRSVGSQSARVRAVVSHRLDAGRIEVFLDGEPVVEERLRASRREPLGLSFLAYNEGEESATFRAPPGDHELRVEVTGSERAELSKSLNVKVEPKGAYVLGISVRSWPKPRLGVDWSAQAQ